MDFLESLIADIRKRHMAKIFESEYADYYAKYRRHYETEVEPSPKVGFFNSMAWDAERRREFSKAFEQLNLKVEPDPIAPLHPYNLEKNGLERLNELQKKIKK